MNTSQQVDILLREYDHLKGEVRTALDVYEKIYSFLVATAAIISGLIGAVNVPDEKRGLLYALIPAMILGILGVVWYGHQIALARLSARLEAIEYRLSVYSGKENLFNWQSHWEPIGRKGFVGSWQKLLALLALLPSIAVYTLAAWQADPWWMSIANPWWSNISGNPMPQGTPFVIYCVFLGLIIILHELWYMRRLRKSLNEEVKKYKEEVNRERKKEVPSRESTKKSTTKGKSEGNLNQG